MPSFNVHEYVTDRNLLFGRNGKGQILDNLLSHIETGKTCLILGERRFGKTSVLKCAENHIKDNTPHLIPIYFDFKKENFIRNSNFDVYRYIFSLSVCQMYNRGLITDRFSIRGMEIVPNAFWEDIYDKLVGLTEVRMQGLLENFILESSEKYEIGFVYLFDEYEHLFTDSLRDPTGFYLFRGITQMPSKNKIKPMVYVVAGCKTWEDICSVSGSPELNNLSVVPLYLEPLDYPYFEKMWNYLLEGFNVIPIGLKDTKNIYNLAGGIPFYGKLIGETITQKGKIHYFDFKSYFIRQLSNLTEKDITILKGVLYEEYAQYKEISLLNLIYRGLLKKLSGSSVDINGILFKEFLLDYWAHNETKDSEFAPEKHLRKAPKKMVSVFISYSHYDTTYKDNLTTALSSLVRENILTYWEDGKLRGGDKWRDEINKAIRGADITLCLLSHDFLASEFCMDIEVLQTLQDSSKKVIPVKMRKCDWENLEIGEHQAIPSKWIVGESVNGNFVSDDNMTDFVRQLRKVIEGLLH